ncbi:MAG: VWA domain-containing protein [Candidatus Dadabacteria bacterium]|nr:MAG: VWA domain-containing protein [Candidatus Dadabacteria bacterium]
MTRKLLLTLSVLLLLAACSKGQKNNAGQAEREVSIKLAHGHELSSYLKSSVEQFALTNPVLADGSKIKVELEEGDNVELANRIAKGFSKPHIWLAPSTSLVQYVNSSTTNLGAKQANCKALFGTPVVLATKKTNQKLFLANDQTLSWDELFELKLKSENKAGVDEYVSLIHASPNHSITGLPAIIELAYLAAYKQKTILDLDTLRSGATSRLLKEYENEVGIYSADDTFLLNRVAAKSAKRARITFTTEQQVALYNASLPAKSEELVAIYPRGGSYWMDYSICQSQATWVTTAEKAAIQKFIDFISGKDAQFAAKRIGMRPAIVEFENVAPLTAKYGIDLSKPEKSLLPVPGQVVSYLLDKWEEFKRPAATVLALDTSASMEGEAAYTSMELLRKLVAKANRNNLFNLVTFSSDSIRSGEFSSDARKLINAINSIRIIGGSAVYDGINTAFTAVTDSKLKKYRKNIVVISDGGDINSRISLRRLLDIASNAAAAHEINLFLIAVKTDQNSFKDLKSINSAADGIYFEVAPSGLYGVFEEIKKHL